MLKRKKKKNNLFIKYMCLPQINENDEINKILLIDLFILDTEFDNSR
jgi:hypothetical protein